MDKYYTRACNFYYGKKAKEKINKRIALPLGSNPSISFDSIEIISRRNKKIFNIKNLNKIPESLKQKIKLDIKNITKTKKIKNLNIKKFPLIMGILNVTPDSFSDGGMFNKKKKTIEHINKLIKNGSQIIDIGAESTRPGSLEISVDEEWKRLKTGLTHLSKKNIFISLDTRKSIIMKKSLPFKISLINDVSGLSHDDDTLKLLKVSKKPFVIHHMKGNPKIMQKKPIYKNVLLDIYDFFEERIQFIRKNGIYHNNIILDPGIGFGKNLKHNITLLNQVSIFHSLGFPILLGTSRKKFIKEISGMNDSDERIGGTVSSCIFSFMQGVQILRVHDVNEIIQSIKVFKKLHNF